jgi:peptidyl-prolyl cis-trans isomerase SurA
MMSRPSSLVLAIAAAGLFVSPRAARAQDFSVVDQIAAIVGDSVIPMSRVDEELNLYRSQGGEVPSDSADLAEFKRQIVEQLINQELLVQAALRDTMIVVSEPEVQAAVERAFREVRGQFASDLEFRRQLEVSNFGSPEEYRRWLADQQRREIMRNQFIQRLREMGQLTPLAPTESELRDFYEATKEQQGERPATVSFRQIVVRVEADSAALAAARGLADSLAQAIRDGADFAQVARRRSADPATRDQGGELGWVRRGIFVPEFEAAAFRLKPGTISNPVYTAFGFHIIQVQRSQPAEVQVRHILIAPEITQDDRDRGRTRVEQVAQGLIDGESFDSLAQQYHDYAGQEQVLVEDFPRVDLPQNYQDALVGAETGDVVGPLTLELPDRRPKFAVIVLQSVRPEGEYSFEDLRDRLRSVLSEQNAMERLMRSLREATYIETRL